MTEKTHKLMKSFFYWKPGDVGYTHHNVDPTGTSQLFVILGKARGGDTLVVLHAGRVRKWLVGTSFMNSCRHLVM